MYQKTAHWLVVITLCLTMIFISGGCANQNNVNDDAQVTPQSQNARMFVANSPASSNVRVRTDIDGFVWLPLEATAKSMNFDLKKVNNSYKIGDTDALCSVKVNQTKARSGDQTVRLPHAPKLFDKKPYMTIQALSALLGTPIYWNGDRSQVMFAPIDDSVLPDQQDGTDGQIRGLALTTADKADIIRFGRRYMGTPYRFGAGPYERTQRFDCSSFVQHVYRNFGVRLPRSSRSQARVGRKVSASQLQTGDLMFFYTPGRFSSNRIVGHVGIYAGNGKILHTYGKPGVTVTDFNSYWRKRFLLARRVG